MTRPADPPSVRILRWPHATDLPLPRYESEGAAGLDLIAALLPDTVVVLAPGARELVPTGLSLELPPGFEAQVRPRSGLALRHGITVLNAPGTVDADFRGEVQVLLINHGQAPFEIRRGTRIAQLVVARVEQVTLVEAQRLSETGRGHGGFGSTGSDGTPQRPVA